MKDRCLNVQQPCAATYIWGVPLVNGVALQRPLVANGVSLSEPSLLVFDQRLTPKQPDQAESP
jgi:hypothetical protein